MSIARARRLRKQMTDAEKRLWSHLRRDGLDGNHFRRQKPVGPFVADFVCVARRLVIEVDGGQHAEHAGADARRTAFLERRGYRVVRFWNNEVLANTEGVLETIRIALNEMERGA